MVTHEIHSDQITGLVI